MTIEDPHTHPIPGSLSFREVSQEAWALANEMRDVLRAEVAYEIAERHLAAARRRGCDDVVYDLEEKLCHSRKVAMGYKKLYLELEAKLAEQSRS